MILFSFLLGMFAGYLSRKSLAWCWYLLLALASESQRKRSAPLRLKKRRPGRRVDLFAQGKKQVWQSPSYSSVPFAAEAGAGVSPDSPAGRSQVLRDDVRDWLRQA